MTKTHRVKIITAGQGGGYTASAERDIEQSTNEFIENYPSILIVKIQAFTTFNGQPGIMIHYTENIKNDKKT